MPCQRSCPHMLYTTDIPIKEVLTMIQKARCEDCDCMGPNLWICLHCDCLRIGCSDEFNDHNTLHNAVNPSHSVHMNLSTHRFWCYMCKSEVFMEHKLQQHSSECGRDRDSGRSSYCSANGSCSGSNSTLLPPDTVVTDNNGVSSSATAAVANVGVGMGGDTSESESSDTEDVVVPNRRGGGSSGGGRPSGLVGLQNIGNTCYLNAALQALSNTVPLTKFFLDCPATVLIVSEGRKPGLSRTYQVLVSEMWLKKKGGYVVPSGILYGIRNVHAMFRGYHQHDTQEFLRNFMDQLHEELKQVWTPDPTSLDLDTYSTAVDEPSAAATAAAAAASHHGSNYESSEGEYETCDSGVSERSSLSDDLERISPPLSSANGGGGGGSSSSSSKRRLSRSTSPNRRLRTRFQNSTVVIENQPTTASSSSSCNKLVSSSGKPQVSYKSIISDIFDGKLLSTVQCLTCNRVSSRVETFQDLSLPIPSRDHLAVIHGRNSAAAAMSSASTQSRTTVEHGARSPSTVAAASTCTEAVLPADNGWIAWILVWIKSWFYGPTITLHDCLAAFFSTDELKGDNMYSCERCNKLRNGIKYSKVLQLPEVLCVHLKRFRHELMFSSKISATVSFPMKGLDMRPYLHADCVSQVTEYELFSVICHHGTAGGGHYTCYALNSGQWYEFDDQCVTRVSAETVQNCEAYVLFYRKITTETCAVKARVAELSREAAHGEMINCDEVFYISRQWLSRFHTCAEPGPIDNRDFLCPHGHVMPERAKALDQLAVSVPKSIYNYLYKKYGGNAPTSATACPHCQAHQCRLDLEMETLMQLNMASQKQPQRPATHLLSKSWYASWLNYVQRKTLDSPGPIDNGATYATPQLGGDDYAEISENIWNFFHSIYGGGPELRLDIKPFSDSSDSNCENSDCNTSETPLLISTCATASKRHKSEERRIAVRVHGCHGEPMDVDDETAATAVDTTTTAAAAASVALDEDKSACSRLPVPDETPTTPNYCNDNSDALSSGGTSNASLTDEDVAPPEKGCARPDATNVRRFYRRRKRDVCK